jgi:hypothetical protein
MDVQASEFPSTLACLSSRGDHTRIIQTGTSGEVAMDRKRFMFFLIYKPLPACCKNECILTHDGSNERVSVSVCAGHRCFSWRVCASAGPLPTSRRGKSPTSASTKPQLMGFPSRTRPRDCAKASVAGGPAFSLRVCVRACVLACVRACFPMTTSDNKTASQRCCPLPVGRLSVGLLPGVPPLCSTSQEQHCTVSVEDTEAVAS